MGSNQGDRLSLLTEAVRRLSKTLVVGAICTSPVYETTPIGPTGDHPFLNAVVEFHTEWEVEELFRFMESVEVALGRRPPREGPRTIDLDLLFFDDLIWQTEYLTIPHPRLHERDFVLRPLGDLDGGFIHPVLKRPIRDLLDDIGDPTCIIGVFAPGIPGPDSQ